METLFLLEAILLVDKAKAAGLEGCRITEAPLYSSFCSQQGHIFLMAKTWTFPVSSTTSTRASIIYMEYTWVYTAKVFKLLKFIDST